ncbi:hypothetical protein BT69DRAFT_149166 [Atractiella rhizophila]|nr:hypothetical protein BT69DRAFT_149166 [Atractiella rhizophila]
MSLPSNGGAWLPDSRLAPPAYTLSGVVAATGLRVDQHQPFDSGFPISNGYAKALPEGSFGPSHGVRDDYSHREHFVTVPPALSETLYHPTSFLRCILTSPVSNSSTICILTVSHWTCLPSNMC